ncbi:MAG: hypothetical protein V1765_02660 [bacterium]
MRVGLIAPMNNQEEKLFLTELSKKIIAIGFQVETAVADSLASYDILIIVFDGRPLSPSDYIQLGIFYGYQVKQQPAKLIIGYQTSLTDYQGEEVKWLDHLATTELNLISCLKDYIYYHQHE